MCFSSLYLFLNPKCACLNVKVKLAAEIVMLYIYLLFNLRVAKCCITATRSLSSSF